MTWYQMLCFLFVKTNITKADVKTLIILLKKLNNKPDHTSSSPAFMTKAEPNPYNTLTWVHR